MAEKSLTVDSRLPPPARRLEQVVQQLLKVSRAEAVQAIHDGWVSVNRRIARKPQTVLEIGDTVTAERAPPPPPKVKKIGDAHDAVRIIYEDEAIAVVYKPAGLLTVPTPKRESNTVIHQLTRLLRDHDQAAEAFCVHRLDRGVSGLLVFAKSLDVAEQIRDQFAARKPDRRYVAIAMGRIEKDQGTIRSYLATDAALNRYSTTEDKGELAITHYRVVERWNDMTRVEVRLETGRRNQNRIHLAELGHPILGDERYGRLTSMHRLWPYKRIALHAESIGFTHPLTGEQLAFQTALPREFHRLIDKRQ